jgi:excinuclease ABC subunit B
LSAKDLEKKLKHLEIDMQQAAQNLEFELAAKLRDELTRLKDAAFYS